jgi:hypothetical protein
VVRPGGLVTAYAWDMEGGGFPYEPLQAELRAMGIAVPTEPSRTASRVDVMQALWSTAGLEAVDTRTITVRRTFADFADYRTTIFGSPAVGPKLKAMAPAELAHLEERLRSRLPADGDGRITCTAWANAVKGLVPRR